MEVRVAKTAGFCFGVTRAVNAVYEACRTEKLCTYGPLINNKVLTDDLSRKGVRIVSDLSVLDGETVVVRSHGAPKEVFEELEHRGVKHIDCTCPHVKKIHKLAAQSQESGRQLLILGDPLHPEVIGIKSYAKGSIVASDLEELKSVNFAYNIKYDLVVQTTYRHEHFSEAANYLKNLGLDIIIWDTICSATMVRQIEAEALAKEMDVMIILGDPLSSNTDKLHQICKQYCKRTFRVESIHNLLLNILNSDDKIGITAGASTPLAITEEAVNFMSDLENTNGNQSFEEMLDESIVTLHTGDIVKGTVIQVNSGGEVSVNLNYKSDGIIPKSEITSDPAVDVNDVVKSGDVIDVYVVRVNDGDGNVLLSKRKIDSQKNYTELEEAYTNKTPVSGKIIEQVKGGLIAMINGLRVFVPSSQISNRYVEDLSVFKGKEFNFNILDFDRSRKRIVAGRKELSVIEQNQRKEEFFSNVQAGQKLEGVVSRIAAFGAFVDLGGVDGLIHISELSWGRVRKVSDVLKEGDHVKVTVLDLNKEKGKISLSLKDVDGNPWNNVADKYPHGKIIQGKVVRIVPFGAFVEIEPGLDGLVHISQIAHKHVAKPEDELSIGDIIRVKVTEIDETNKKISLSKKEADGMMTTEEKAEAELKAEIPTVPTPEEFPADPVPEEIPLPDAPEVIPTEEA
ncbi:MAG: bifunctional 4-hydroxy-3-methylbut-2-enyl diphosphate reductase/30S ribosomal protein S1 [Clostridiales bacterium]|jgi:4-hydroxy-3-methylbut-2-enyl diphosphate reductase|nr:bifunctional 4-hydroxy-3-methylbut-2-enyl diphosphate reductase/30S ribosomal protein S1 [Clostridiales bacterium]